MNLPQNLGHRPTDASFENGDLDVMSVLGTNQKRGAKELLMGDGRVHF